MPDTANTTATPATIVTYVNPADIWNYDGTGTSTLGVNAIQIVVTSTKNLTIYVDQGNVNNAFQLTDTYEYLTTKQFGITIQAVGAFVRVRAKNNSGSSATATIDTVLCPIVEALPRSLDEHGHLKTHVLGNTDGYGFEAENTPQGDMRSIVPMRQVGVVFEGNTLDTNYWRTILQANGTVTQSNGRVDMLTTTDSGSGSTLYSNRRARHVAGYTQVFRMAGRLGDTGSANNNRQFGVGLLSNYTLTINSAAVVAGDIYTDTNGVQYTILKSETTTTPLVYATGAPTAGAQNYTRVSGTGTTPLVGSAFTVNSQITDGYFFQLGGAGGTVFSVNTAIGGTVTPVNSGSFNGDVGATYTVNNEMQTWEIYYNSKSVWFTINGVLLHTISDSTTPLVNSQTLNIILRNASTGVGSVAGLYTRSVSVKTLSPLETEKVFLYSTSNSTKILKYSAGRLYKVIFGNPKLAQVVTLYDGLSVQAPIIAALTNVAEAQNDVRCHTEVVFDCPFHNGLTMVTSTTAPVTCIYE